MAASVSAKNGTEIQVTSKNESMPIAKTEPNDTNSLNVSTQVSNPLEAKNDTALRLNDEAEQETDALVDEETRQRQGTDTDTCMDKDDNCAIWKSHGHCYEQWMNKNCAKSCDICTSGVPEKEKEKARVTVNGESCRQDFPCGTHEYSYYWCWTSDDDDDWDYCCRPNHTCDKHGSDYNWCYVEYWTGRNKGLEQRSAYCKPV